VEIPHQGVVRLVVGSNYLHFDNRQTFLQLAPVSFDASTFELWGALLHGARCVLYPEKVPSAGTLGEILRRHRVSTLWLTASLFNALVDEAPQSLQGVSTLLTGGEQLSSAHIRRGQEQLPQTRFFNGYGPTESTTFTTCYAIPGKMDGETAIPIGRPIANTRVFVLDKQRNLVPIGVPGELYIGGDGLARGYLNRAELTRERFVPNPFSGDPAMRLYRTGDLVRWRADGNLEFLGRLDHQIKLRGFRIELGEIEAALEGHPGIRQAAVVIRQQGCGDQRLVAYVIHADGAFPSLGVLHEYLAEKLPDYMIPAEFVALKVFPLNPNGKIDRDALPSSAGVVMVKGRAEAQPPRSPTEKTLAEIWTDLLGLDQVGVHDNFFDLGVRLFSRIEKTFGKKLPLATLFQTPSIDRLAQVLDDAIELDSHPSFVQLGNNHGSKVPIFFLHSMGGEVFFGRGLTSHLGPDRPIYGFKPILGIGGMPLAGSFESIADQYAKLLLEFQPQGPYCLFGYSFGGLLAYEVARNLITSGYEVPLLAIIDTGPRRKNASFFQWVKNMPNLLKNVSNWVNYDLLVTNPEDFGSRLLRKGRTVKRRVSGFFQANGSLEPGRMLEEIFDMESLPQEYHVIMKEYFRALQNYEPKPYPGSVTLFRALAQPLIRIHDPDLGWSRLAMGGVKVITIPGNHITMFKEPYVHSLGKELAVALAQVDRNA
jgi:thioesterase domain-containing protein